MIDWLPVAFLPVWEYWTNIKNQQLQWRVGLKSISIFYPTRWAHTLSSQRVTIYLWPLASHTLMLCYTILRSAIKCCLYHNCPVHLMEADNCLSRAQWLHPIFDDTHRVSVQKAQLIYFSRGGGNFPFTITLAISMPIAWVLNTARFKI